jgi:uncharacterized membrane protein
MTPAPLLRPLLLGVVTGLRSQLGLAVLAWSEPASPADPRRLRALRSRPGRIGAAAAAVGELVADKLPQTSSRLHPAVFGGRLVSGAVVGVLAAGSAGRRQAVLAGAAGMAGAAAGAYAGTVYRRTLPARTGTPDLPWALAEDAVAATVAIAAVAASKRG